MCYDMPVPKCSQTPCQTSGQCSAGTSACSNQQSNTATVCPQAAAGQPKPPYASGGCQQVSFSSNIRFKSVFSINFDYKNIQKVCTLHETKPVECKD